MSPPPRSHLRRSAETAVSSSERDGVAGEKGLTVIRGAVSGSASTPLTEPLYGPCTCVSADKGDDACVLSARGPSGGGHSSPRARAEGVHLHNNAALIPIDSGFDVRQPQTATFRCRNRPSLLSPLSVSCAHSAPPAAPLR